MRILTLRLRKCDESKPECRNCTRRSLPCYYNTAATTTTTSNAASTPPVPAEEVTPSESPNLEDLQLWHHWLMTVSSTFSNDASSLVMWRDNISKVALKHRFVAQLLLALSALHLARLGGDESISYMARSTALQTSAMDGMMAALSDEPSQSRSSALFVAAMVLCFCSLGKGPSPGQYLVYSDDGVPPWMDLLQGVKSINSQNRGAIAGLTVEAEPEPGEPVNPEELFPGYSKATEDLSQHIAVLQAEDQSFGKYTKSLEVLKSSFETAFERQNNQLKTKSHLILAWMYRIDEDFQIALQERRPMALVILAHYMAIFAKLAAAWFVDGWARHIMNAVERDIHPAYARWLEWPALQLNC